MLQNFRPKHFVSYLSKYLNNKDFTKVQRIFDLLWFVFQKFQGNIALFNQISNKQFLFKITSLLGMKNIPEQCKIKIVDLIYEWKQTFKPNKQLFPNFWSFFQNIQKKGFQPSNNNFQTKYQTPAVNTTVVNKKAESSKDIFDLMQNDKSYNFSELDKSALLLFSTLLNKTIQTNKIINNTDPQILDFPPVIKQHMAQLKITQQKVNKYINQTKNEVTLQTAIQLVQTIHLTEKRYTELITRYIPQEFRLSPLLLRFSEYCTNNSELLNKQTEPKNSQIDLLDLNTTQKKPEKTSDLLDLNIQTSNTQAQTGKSGIVNFFGNILNRQSVPANITLSNQPIQNDFRTDLDFKGYQDPKPIMDHLNDLSDMMKNDLLFKKPANN